MQDCIESDISIIIPVRNGGASFRRCLSSLASAVPSPLEIIVVADGDTDGSWRMAQELGFQVLRISIPVGPARARNIGAREARGAILFFVDADVAIPTDLIGRVGDAFRRDPDLAALFGSYDDDPAETNFISQYKNLFHHHMHQEANINAVTFWAACGAIRREVFQDMGGFGEGYRQPSVEDIDLGYRLTRAGHKIRLSKEMQVKHLKRWGLISLVKSDFFLRALPWTRLILRERRFTSDLNLRVPSRVSVGLTYGLFGSLVGTGSWGGFLPLACLMMLLLVVLNAPLYRFYQRKRGLGFALKIIPLHWFYYLYGGLAFLIGVVQYLCERVRAPLADIREASEGSESLGDQRPARRTISHIRRDYRRDNTSR